MTVESLIAAMPKVELHIHLEGAINKERLLMIADQNEIAAEQKKTFANWRAQLDNPEYAHLPELIAATCGWIQHPDDIAHVVYELGVMLAKQHVVYAEVSVNPTHFTDQGWAFDAWLKAMNDGRDRAERGWGIKMRWVLNLRRDQPRQADEMVRIASSVSGQNKGIVGVDLSGPETALPVGQFERAFRTADRKQIFTSAHAGEQEGGEGVFNTLEVLQPDRLNTGWGALDSSDAIQYLIDKGVPLVISQYEAVKAGWIETAEQYPLRALLDEGVTVCLCSDMPIYYGSSLNHEYLLAVEAGGLEVDELEQLALNAVRACRLPAPEKAELLEKLSTTYAQLRTDNTN